MMKSFLPNNCNQSEADYIGNYFLKTTDDIKAKLYSEYTQFFHEVFEVFEYTNTLFHVSLTRQRI